MVISTSRSILGCTSKLGRAATAGSGRSAAAAGSGAVAATGSGTAVTGGTASTSSGAASAAAASRPPAPALAAAPRWLRPPVAGSRPPRELFLPQPRSVLALGSLPQRPRPLQGLLLLQPPLALRPPRAPLRLRARLQRVPAPRPPRGLPLRRLLPVRQRASRGSGDSGRLPRRQGWHRSRPRHVDRNQ